LFDGENLLFRPDKIAMLLFCQPEKYFNRLHEINESVKVPQKAMRYHRSSCRFASFERTIFSTIGGSFIKKRSL
jgi:hypothetical protein